MKIIMTAENITNITAQNTEEKKTSLLSYIVKTEPELVSFAREGDLIEAALLLKKPKAVYFDLGKFGTGIVCGLEYQNAKDILKSIESGEKISAKVVAVDNEEGFIELSLAGAHKQKEWQGLKEIMENEEVLTVKIIGANSGGLLANINNIKAFLPVSHLSNNNYPKIENSDKNEIVKELRKLVNAELKVKIIDLNPRTGKLIISEKEAAEEDMKKLLANYKVGDVIDGVVSGVTNFGAFVRFVDNPAIEGLAHISEIGYRLIDHPKEVVKIDDAVKVKIVDIKDNQVFLSLKALLPDPWLNIAEKFKENQEIEGTVYKFNPIGALINIEHDLQGLIHVSEFGGIEEMKKQLEAGKQYKFIIHSIKPEERRIFLKLKA